MPFSAHECGCERNRQLNFEDRNDGANAPEPPKDPDGVVIIEGKKYARPEGLARLLGRSLRTLDRWEKDRTGPPRIKIGKLRLYDLSLVPEWLKQNERKFPEARRGRA